MKTIILAAGKGSRLRPLTLKTPKPLLKIHGKTIIEYNLDRLPEEIDEIIFVINYLGEQIQNYFGNQFGRFQISYVWQKKFLGTGDALWSCQEKLKNEKKFLVFNGDDIYTQTDIKKCLKHKRSLLAYQTKNSFKGGKIILDSQNQLQDIMEGTHQAGNNLLNTGLYVLDNNIFKYKLRKTQDKDEFGLPQTIIKMSRDFPMQVKLTKSWISVGTLEDYEKAQKILS